MVSKLPFKRPVGDDSILGPFIQRKLRERTMIQPTESSIRRRADGSIDADYYLARGLAERSNQAHHLLGVESRSLGRILSKLNRHLEVADPAGNLRYRARPGLGLPRSPARSSARQNACV